MTKRQKTLVFHIGDPKTGSSSIQQALFDHSWSSPGHSVAYPDRLNAIPLAKSLYDDAPPDQRQRQFAATAEWLGHQTADMAVLSAEHFSFLAPAAFRAAVERFLPEQAGNMRVIAYARPHIARLVSTYAQRVKTRGLNKTFEAFCHASVKKGSFRYTPRFLAWRETFGADFTLRPMLRPLLYRQDVVADFLHTLLDTDDFTVTGGNSQNQSPTIDHLACLLLVQTTLRRANIAQPLRQALCSSLAGRLARSAATSGRRLKMPRPVLAQMQDAYRADAAALDAAFFTGSPFSDALEEAGQGATDDPQSIAAKDCFDAAQRKGLRRVTGEIILELQADPDSWKQHYREGKSRKEGSDKGNIASVMRIETLLEDICVVLK